MGVHESEELPCLGVLNGGALCGSWLRRRQGVLDGEELCNVRGIIVGLFDQVDSCWMRLTTLPKVLLASALIPVLDPIFVRVRVVLTVLHIRLEHPLCRTAINPLTRDRASTSLNERAADAAALSSLVFLHRCVMGDHAS